jgi:hypothetical protein
MINVELPRISRQFFYDKRCWASSSERRNYGFKELRSIRKGLKVITCAIS